MFDHIYDVQMQHKANIITIRCTIRLPTPLQAYTVDVVIDDIQRNIVRASCVNESSSNGKQFQANLISE